METLNRKVYELEFYGTVPGSCFTSYRSFGRYATKEEAEEMAAAVLDESGLDWDFIDRLNRKALEGLYLEVTVRSIAKGATSYKINEIEQQYDEEIDSWEDL